MSLKVIGAGFGRTGTMSLKYALEQLGFAPCYHMVETLEHPGHDAMWLALARGQSDDWRAPLDGYAASVDWPAIMIWKELAATYPASQSHPHVARSGALVRECVEDDLRQDARIRRGASARRC